MTDTCQNNTSPLHCTCTPEQAHLYRPNVGIMIINKNKKVWFGTRAEAHKYKSGCFTQMPQGGIDKGETVLQAALRELWEETGITADKVCVIAQTKQWLYYRFPEKVYRDKYIGQKQKWVLVQFLGDDSDFNLDVNPEEIEFSKFEWLDLQQAPDNVVDFKKDVYRCVVKYFEPIIEEL